MGEPTSIATILEGLVKKRRWAGILTAQRVREIWEKAASRGLRDHCRVASWRNGVLELDTDSPVWSQEVSLLSEELAKKINQEAGEDLVEKIIVRTRRRSG
jgi:predicted nucleic acid-binding Zn ribbon protein